MVNRFGPSVILRKLVRTGIDADGNDVFAPSDTTVIADAKWLRATFENTDSRETLTDEMSLLFTGVPELTGIDEVILPEGVFLVDGNPLPFKHPRVGLEKTQVNLKKATG